jgi:circadian clock protein KaiC
MNNCSSESDQLNASKLINKLYPHTFILKEEDSNKKLYFEHLHIAQYEMHESGKYNIDGLFVRIEHAMNAINAKRIVLDSLDTLFTNLDINMLRNDKGNQACN